MLDLLRRLWRYLTSEAEYPFCSETCPRRKPDGGLCDECAAWWSIK